MHAPKPALHHPALHHLSAFGVRLCSLLGYWTWSASSLLSSALRLAHSHAFIPSRTPRVGSKCVSPVCQACWEHGDSVGKLGHYGVRDFMSNHVTEGQSEVPEQELMDYRLGGLGL